MKHYKVVMEDDAEELEEEINKLAKEGYEVISFIPVGVETASALMVKEAEENSEKPRFVCEKCAFYLPPKGSSAARCMATNKPTYAENKCNDMEAREKAFKEGGKQ